MVQSFPSQLFLQVVQSFPSQLSSQIHESQLLFGVPWLQFKEHVQLSIDFPEIKQLSHKSPSKYELHSQVKQFLSCFPLFPQSIPQTLQSFDEFH